VLSTLATAAKDEALESIATALEANAPAILAANAADVATANTIYWALSSGRSGSSGSTARISPNSAREWDTGHACRGCARRVRAQA